MCYRLQTFPLPTAARQPFSLAITLFVIGSSVQAARQEKQYLCNTAVSTWSREGTVCPGSELDIFVLLYLLKEFIAGRER